MILVYEFYFIIFNQIIFTTLLRYLEIIHYTKIRNTFPQLYFDANIRVQSIIA